MLVTYDPDGGYGHPDHIQAHRVAMRAAELAAEPAFRRDLGEPHTVAKIYWNRVPRSVVEEGFARLAGALGSTPFAGIAEVGDVPGVVDDAAGHRRDRRHAPTPAAKAAAMRAHATQIARRRRRSSRSPTTSASRSSPSSTTSWCAARPRRRDETDLFAGVVA